MDRDLIKNIFFESSLLDFRFSGGFTFLVSLAGQVRLLISSNAFCMSKEQKARS